MKTIDAPKGLESPVWAYFGFKSENGKDISDKGTTVCKICKIELVYKTGSTSNLRRHLDRKHPHVKLDTPQSNKAVACKRTSENEIKGSEPKKQMRQSTLDEVQIRENTPQISAQKASKFTDAIAKFIVKDLRPISVVSNEGFRNLLKVLQPGYVVPSASHFSQQVIPNLYDATKSNVLKYIKEASALATTTDGWTSRSTDSYITITVHCLNESFEMTSFVLQTRELSVSHTAENLSEVVNCAIKEWGLIKDGLKPNITTDNAANIVNAVFKSGLVHVRCMAHTLNLATQKGMKVEGLSEILRKVRRIVGFFHRSSTAAALLKSNQIGLNVPVPKHKLIQDVETRWNSSFDMLKRILEQKHVISATLMMKDIKLKDKDGVNNLTEEDYAAIEDIVQVLSPFKTATEALLGERYPTVSLIFSMKMTLLTHLKPALSDSDMVKRMKEVMHADLSTRYNGQETEQFLLEASILDPRFKLVPHATEEQKAKAYGSFRDQMLSILQTKN